MAMVSGTPNMRRVEYNAYGDSSVLRLQEVPVPRPGRGEILIRVHAAALNPKDVLVRLGKFSLLAGRRFPKRVGSDWAGVVAEVGAGVDGIRPGDALFGMIQSWGAAGTCAEYVTARAAECAPKPEGLSFEEAAAVPLAALTALQALRDVARVQAGSRVLLNGAAGGVGVFAIQLARALGGHVTTTSSAGNLALCRDLGAHVALDYAAQDVLARGEPYDVIFDIFGNRRFADARRALTPRGTFVATVPHRHVLLAVALTLLARQRARLVVVRSRAADLRALGHHVAAGRLRPVIDRVYPLAEIAAAQDHLATRHARGKVVIQVV
ncbi:MAG: NAD(P)-dependent alcohol dehydrogenase [Candidatus Rokuibacteriota bacterium]